MLKKEPKYGLFVNTSKCEVSGDQSFSEIDILVTRVNGLSVGLELLRAPIWGQINISIAVSEGE